MLQQNVGQNPHDVKITVLNTKCRKGIENIIWVCNFDGKLQGIFANKIFNKSWVCDFKQTHSILTFKPESQNFLDLGLRKP